MKESAFILLIVCCSLREFAVGQNRPSAPLRGESNLVIQRADIPLYPGMAKVARIGGTVRIEVTVKHGNVAHISVVRGSAPILVDAAVNNVKTWTFLPDVDTTFVTTFVFAIDKHESAFPENPRIEMELPKLVKLTARPTKGTCMDCGTETQ